MKILFLVLFFILVFAYDEVFCISNQYMRCCKEQMKCCTSDADCTPIDSVLKCHNTNICYKEANTTTVGGNIYFSSCPSNLVYIGDLYNVGYSCSFSIQT